MALVVNMTIFHLLTTRFVDYHQLSSNLEGNREQNGKACQTFSFGWDGVGGS